MEKQNGQMNAPHPGTNLPPDYPPQYPSATLQGPPGHTGYPGPQVGYPGPQVGYPGPQAGYRGPQAGYPGPQAGYSIPPAGYSGAGPVGFPVQHQPVYNQPGGRAGVPWMPAPPPPSGCPPGLEYLSQIDQILVHQQIELLEVITGFETNNKYEIKNSFGQKIYFAVEDTDCCTRNCCGASRPFTMRIIDNMGQEVITLERPLRCDSCCCPCCLQEIKSLDEETIVGKISKQWTGFVREAFTDADNFGIQFPLDLDVKMKAVMLGACFLIDFMFFERSGNTE
ncbi:phospholipid scramblase 1 isoform X2 [Prionailurus viverrinus]|uniref:phospholipid scramblase 1 isoform X2 n=1 Tax=Prionailurus viverrinus TaxID=61388 RepID=UPI001FF40764|nr:phospholipid scramblase 1 isoform X2 [Prionailurus viverrinus]